MDMYDIDGRKATKCRRQMDISMRKGWSTLVLKVVVWASRKGVKSRQLLVSIYMVDPLQHCIDLYKYPVFPTFVYFLLGFVLCLSVFRFGRLHHGIHCKGQWCC